MVVKGVGHGKDGGENDVEVLESLVPFYFSFFIVQELIFKLGQASTLKKEKVRQSRMA